MSGPVVRVLAVGWRRATASAVLPATLTIAGLGIATSPANAEMPLGPTGPAASAVMHSLTDGEIMRCNDLKLREINCQRQLNWLQPTLFYGDANGQGANSDVLVITFYNGDPTGRAQDLSVSYFRLIGGRYRYVRSFRNVHMAELAPEANVTFGHGHVSFVGVTTRPGESFVTPTGRTRYVLDLR